jgi:hypothetical protein
VQKEYTQTPGTPRYFYIFTLFEDCDHHFLVLLPARACVADCCQTPCCMGLLAAVLACALPAQWCSAIA